MNPSGANMATKLNVAIVGLGFGSEFIPIYQRHPNANMYAICQRSEDKLNQIGDAFGVKVRYNSIEKLLEDPQVDIVHINSPIHEHAPMSVAALKAGKHVASTVPMATSVEECWQIVEAAKASGKKYMMMETVIYSREYLFVKELRDTGKLGKIQFLRAAHQQDMYGWPGYWEGLPPMHYATHVVSPCLAMGGGMAEYVSCFGSGRIAENLIPKYGSPFAVESAHIKLKDSDLSAEVTRSLFDVARQYIESFDVYGSKLSFEWQLISNEEPTVHLGGEEAEHRSVPDYAHLLPEEIRQFTTKGVYDMEENQHLSFIQGSGHGGSHPHLAHEFLMAVIEDRDPFPNVFQSANWTSVGILAHESAMQGGKIIQLPDYK
jgi:predicted dehydrogenase